MHARVVATSRRPSSRGESLHIGVRARRVRPDRRRFVRVHGKTLLPNMGSCCSPRVADFLLKVLKNSAILRRFSGIGMWIAQLPKSSRDPVSLGYRICGYQATETRRSAKTNGKRSKQVENRRISKMISAKTLAARQRPRNRSGLIASTVAWAAPQTSTRAPGSLRPSETTATTGLGDRPRAMHGRVLAGFRSGTTATPSTPGARGLEDGRQRGYGLRQQDVDAAAHAEEVRRAGPLICVAELDAFGLAPTRPAKGLNRDDRCAAFKSPDPSGVYRNPNHFTTTTPSGAGKTTGLQRCLDGFGGEGDDVSR